MNQSQQTEKQMGKRIVSKRDYAKVVGQELGIILIFIALIVVVVVCGIGALISAFFFVGSGFALMYYRETNGGFALLLLTVTVLLGAASLLFGKLAVSVIKTVTDSDPIIPLTRASTADLSAPDSLVRASAEPIQEQQAMLLRAAIQIQETHEEQLVRAVER